MADGTSQFLANTSTVGSNTLSPVPPAEPKAFAAAKAPEEVRNLPPAYLTEDGQISGHSAQLVAIASSVWRNMEGKGPLPQKVIIQNDSRMDETNTPNPVRIKITLMDVEDKGPRIILAKDGNTPLRRRINKADDSPAMLAQPDHGNVVPPDSDKSTLQADFEPFMDAARKKQIARRGTNLVLGGG